MNQALKSPKLYITLAVAILGVLLTQGVIVGGSTAAQVVGWIVAFLGTLGTGHTVGSTPSDPPSE